MSCTEEKDADAIFEQYCKRNIISGEDMETLGRSLFPCGMSDDLLLEAGTFSLFPKSGVTSLSSTFDQWMGTSTSRQAIQNGERFIYDTVPYISLVEATDLFDYIPVMFMPMHVTLLWGYVVVLPDPENESSTVMWGDSLRHSPSEWLLQSVTLDLVILYREVRFTISARNHLLDVLQFATQEDCYSCGVYVLAAMAIFCTNSDDEMFPVDTFKFRYNAALTERYRVSSIRSLVRHMLMVYGRNEAITAMQISKSMKRDIRLRLEQANVGGVLCMDIYLLQNALFYFGNTAVFLLRAFLSSLRDDRMQYLYLAQVYCQVLLHPLPDPRPFIRTLRLSEGLCNISFTYVLDLGTIFMEGFFKAPLAQVLGGELAGSGDPEEFGIPESNTIPNSHNLLNSALHGTRDATDSVAPEGPSHIDNPVVLPPQDECEKELLEDSASLNVEAWNVVEEVNNIFPTLAQRSVERHTLRNPEYSLFKSPSSPFPIRMHLRCRMHDPPAKWDKNVPYERCQARLYARRYRAGGWQLKFRYQHNHRIQTRSQLSQEELRNTA